MALSPLADRVVIKALEPETKTAGGIIIPDNAKEKPQRGEIVAVGPGKSDDKVLYGKYAGTEVNVDGQDLLIMRETDVLAKY